METHAQTTQARTPTPVEQIDEIVARLAEHSERFAKRSIEERIGMLRGILAGYSRIAERSVRAACEAKGIPFGAPRGGEEWLAGPMPVIRNLRLLIRSLTEFAKQGHIRLPRVATLPNGRVTVRVYPADLSEKLLFSGFEAWVRQDPSVTEENLEEKIAGAYRTPPSSGKVCLVLGAGNVASIPAMDALYKMFVERKSVILKMNPVNAYLGPFIEEAFRELVDAGYFAVVYGGAEVGAYLVEHEGVDEIHITGSNHTHDRIVWGPPGPEREARIAANDPLVKKEITSELGNVSPIVVVPGVFSEKELDFQAANIASMLANNAGFNCNAAKLLVLSRPWPQRERFLERLAEKFGEIPPRKAYYPGAAQRHRRFLEAHAHVATFGEAREGELPWALIRDIDPEARNDLCFREEAFCSILGETSLPEKDPLVFLDRAVTFCNEAVWGTLNITLIVPSGFERNEREAMLAAIDRLRYGTVAINHWAGLVYGMVSPPWGAFPGSPLTDIQSGRGWVHNTFLFDAPQKVVLRGPLTVSPRPAWFYDHRSVHELGRRLTRFEETGSLVALPGLVLTALKG